MMPFLNLNGDVPQSLSGLLQNCRTNGSIITGGGVIGQRQVLRGMSEPQVVLTMKDVADGSLFAIDNRLYIH